MVKKGLFISMIALLIAAVAGFSGCRRHSPAHKAEFIVDYISETLDLTEDQQAQLNQIKDELMEKAQQMRTDKESMHAELIAQLRSEEIDQSLVKARIAQHKIINPRHMDTKSFIRNP